MPKLITMLTHNDETVQNAREVFGSCADLPCDFWGFKDIGLPKPEMRRLVKTMKDEGKTTFLEIVSLTEHECMDGAKLAVECGFDYLMGTVFFPSVSRFLSERKMKYLPFCGKVTGHPSVIEGTVADVVEDGRRLEGMGVHGLDLLAYRFTGDCVELARRVLESIRIPVVVAGSISGFERIDVVKKLSPWAFTIGSAFFEGKFAPRGRFRDQMERVLGYLEQ